MLVSFRRASAAQPGDAPAQSFRQAAAVPPPTRAASPRCRHAARRPIDAGPGNVPSATAEEPPTRPSERSTWRSIKIAKLQSVSAKLEQDVEMLNQKFKITGDYMKAPNSRVYSLLEIGGGLPDTKGKFLQVCDGETLWVYELVLDQAFYRRWTIKPMLERLNSPDLDRESRTMAMSQLGLAGPETLLIGLRKNIRFDMKEATVLDGRKVWKIHGTWKSRQGLQFDTAAGQSHGGLASLHSHGRKSLSGNRR